MSLKAAVSLLFFASSFIYCQTNWTIQDSLHQRSEFSSMAYGKNIYVIVIGTGAIFTSVDGTTWINRANPSTKPLYFVTCANNQFIAIGETGTVLTSPDGITWTQQSSGSTETFASVGYGNGLYIIVGSNGTILTSSDAKTWTKQTSATKCFLNGIAYNDSFFVIAGDYGTQPDTNSVILTSPDGITWTKQSSGVATTLWPVAYGNGVFVVINNAWYRSSKNGAMILYSSDGIAWNKVIGLTDYLQHVIFGRGQFIAVGANGLIITSKDGKAWSPQSSGVKGYLISAVYGNDQYIAMDMNGIIITSPADIPTSLFVPLKKYASMQDLGIRVIGSSLRIDLPATLARQDVHIECFSLNGRKTLSKYIRHTEASFHVPIINFSSGFYLITAYNGSALFRKAFVVSGESRK